MQSTGIPQPGPVLEFQVYLRRKRKPAGPPITTSTSKSKSSKPEIQTITSCEQPKIDPHRQEIRVSLFRIKVGSSVAKVVAIGRHIIKWAVFHPSTYHANYLNVDTGVSESAQSRQRHITQSLDYNRHSRTAEAMAQGQGLVHGVVPYL
jgi:hypothetical protein